MRSVFVNNLQWNKRALKHQHLSVLKTVASFWNIFSDIMFTIHLVLSVLIWFLKEKLSKTHPNVTVSPICWQKTQKSCEKWPQHHLRDTTDTISTTLTKVCSLKKYSFKKFIYFSHIYLIRTGVCSHSSQLIFSHIANNLFADAEQIWYWNQI